MRIFSLLILLVVASALQPSLQPGNHWHHNTRSPLFSMRLMGKYIYYVLHSHSQPLVIAGQMNGRKEEQW